MTVALQARGLTKRFPGVAALDDVTVELRDREVLGLIGQNGSGKSTLLKILAGIQRPDAGELVLRGQPLHLDGIADANRHGIGIVFQEQSLVPNLTVAENLFMGRRTAAGRGGLFRRRLLERDAARQLAKIDSPVAPGAAVEALSFAERQMVELAKVLTLEEQTDAPLVVLLDEPTSVLGGEEVAALFAQIRRLRERSSVVFVSHRLDEVLAVSDRVYVLADGRLVAECQAATADTDQLYRHMVGEERAEDEFLATARHPAASGDVRLRAERVSVRDRCHDVSFQVRAGEVLGLAGVVGSGREAVARALFGAEPIAGGSVEIDGRPAVFRGPAAAVAAGVGYVPAERRVEGMVAGRSVHDNAILVADRDLGHGPLIDRRTERAGVAEIMRRLRVKAPSTAVRIDALSGGNQQKVVLAKWLLSPRLRVLVLDHPTRGLDLRAKADVYELIRALTGDGIAIVLLSDTLEELIGLSDEILVLRDGHVTGRFTDVPAAPPSQPDLVRLMV